MLLATSCIVADPPEYRNPVQTRPVLIVAQAVPPIQRVLVIDSKAKLGAEFTVPVRSEDGGEDMSALLFVDYGVHPGEARLFSQTITASTYDNTGRKASFTWTPTGVQGGCHFVTIVVAHRSSFLANDSDHLKTIQAQTDAALVSWVVNVDPASGQENTLVNCPVSTPTLQ